MARPVGEDAAGMPPDGRFDDIAAPAAGGPELPREDGLARERRIFLQGCGLPRAWAGQAQWRIVDTRFGLGTRFLAAWQAWRDDAARPGLLHFVAVEPQPAGAGDLLRDAAQGAAFAPLASELAAQWFGLLPGVHRLVFEEGRVLLTLCVGEAAAMLREQHFEADSIFLDDTFADAVPAMREPPVLKSLARLCRRGAGIASCSAAPGLPQALTPCGFRLEEGEALAPGHQCLRGVFDPHWQPRGTLPARAAAGDCIVVGGGLAGAAAAASLARRGWRVTVLDAAQEPASGASGLPAGLMAPHQSPDDNLLSRLTRAGVRATLQQARSLLREGVDWGHTGVLEVRLDDARPAPALGDAGAVWCETANPARRAQSLLAQDTQAWWHAAAGWLRPGALVQAWLRQPRVTWRGGCRVSALARDGSQWRVCADDGGEWQADLVVVAAALGSMPLLDGALTLHAVRGQVSFAPGEPPQHWPAQPVNGHGHFLPHVPLPGGAGWICGASYGRGETATDIRQADHAANLERLRVLVPEAAAQVAPQFADASVQGWAGVRCASSDRRPLAGLVAPGLAVLTALGSRGLTFAALCGELLAARVHGEPLPLSPRLADALDVQRQLAARQPRRAVGD